MVMLTRLLSDYFLYRGLWILLWLRDAWSKASSEETYLHIGLDCLQAFCILSET